jgi:hypothetical protein
MASASRKLARQRRRQRKRASDGSLPWTPFEVATYNRGPEVFNRLSRREDHELYVNSRYQVAVYPASSSGGLIHLCIKNRDRSASRDWRDFQRIKNELVGEEYEAIELYPKESRLVDMADQYHLWVLPKENLTFGFGFQKRKVSEWVHPESRGSQRPWPSEDKPKDLLSGQDLLAQCAEMSEDFGEPSQVEIETEEKSSS